MKNWLRILPVVLASTFLPSLGKSAPPDIILKVQPPQQASREFHVESAVLQRSLLFQRVITQLPNAPSPEAPALLEVPAPHSGCFLKLLIFLHTQSLKVDSSCSLPDLLVTQRWFQAVGLPKYMETEIRMDRSVLRRLRTSDWKPILQTWLETRDPGLKQFGKALLKEFKIRSFTDLNWEIYRLRDHLPRPSAMRAAVNQTINQELNLEETLRVKNYNEMKFRRADDAKTHRKLQKIRELLLHEAIRLTVEPGKPMAIEVSHPISRSLNVASEVQRELYRRLNPKSLCSSILEDPSASNKRYRIKVHCPNAETVKHTLMNEPEGVDREENI